MRWDYHQLVAEELGEPDGVLMFDETGFVKKGKDSVGVARQYCGTLGKVENCQVGVFAGYASRQGYALVDKRLFLPEAWFTDAYAARRITCNVPTELTFSTKPQLAAAMLQAIAHEGLLPFSMWWRIASMAIALTFSTPWMPVSGSRRSLQSRRRRAAGSNVPCTGGQELYPYKGAVRSKRVVVAPRPQLPCTVAAVAASLPASHWYRRTVSEGHQRADSYAFAPPTRDAV